MAATKLIDAHEAKAKLRSVRDWFGGPPKTEQDKLAQAVVKMCIEEIDNLKPVDAVSRGVHDQVRWERDTDIGQLEEHGIPFGGIAPDVVKVVRCKDCKNFCPYEGAEHKGDCAELVGLESCVYEDDFCSYGERRDRE